jgi:hypothetical protein
MGDETTSFSAFEDFFEFKDGKISVKEGSDTSFATKLLIDKVNQSARNQTAETVKDLVLKATVATVANIQMILENYTNLINEIKGAVIEQTPHN